MTQVGQVSVGLGLDDANFKQGLKKASSDVQKFAGTMKTALGGIAIGVAFKKVVDSINNSVEAYRKQVIAAQSLNVALQNAGQYTDEYSLHLQQLASDLQKVTNYGDEVTLQALAQGQAFAGNVKFTDELVKATMDFAAATNTDLNSAFKLVGKSIGSQTNALGRYGISLDKNMSKQEKAVAIQRELAKRFDGTAQTMANSSVQLKNALGDLSESFGAVFNPTVQTTQKILAGLVNWLDNGVKAVNHWYGNYISWIAKLRGMDADVLKQKMGYQDLSKGITSSSTKIVSANKEISQSTSKVKDEYQSFVDAFKSATNEYNATLKARKYVEGTLGLTNLSEDYNNALEVYRNYYLKRAEIEQSTASNKASLLKMSETQLQQDLQKIALEKTDETAKKQWELIKSYQDAQIEIQRNQQASDELGGFLGSFATGYSEKLSVLKWYYAEYDRITNTAFTDRQSKLDAYNELEKVKLLKQGEVEKEIWQRRGQDIRSIFNSTLSTMLTNYGDFGDNMKQLALNLTNYIIQELLSLMWATVQASAFMKTAKSWFGGLFGGLFSGLFHSGGTILPTGSKHHYGGSMLPQTDQTEHFALLKNNERVLSPSETAAYNQGQGNSSPNYIVYAPQVRAMDSRDVASWFNDNKQQIISIVSTGIKDNNQGLRTQIQGVS